MPSPSPGRVFGSCAKPTTPAPKPPGLSWSVARPDRLSPTHAWSAGMPAPAAPVVTPRATKMDTASTVSKRFIRPSPQWYMGASQQILAGPPKALSAVHQGLPTCPICQWPDSRTHRQPGSPSGCGSLLDVSAPATNRRAATAVERATSVLTVLDLDEAAAFYARLGIAPVIGYRHQRKRHPRRAPSPLGGPGRRRSASRRSTESGDRVDVVHVCPQGSFC